MREQHEATGLPVVVIPVTDHAYQQPWDVAAGLSPENWLGVLNGASMVITDSFHGAAFSMLLEKDVRILRRYNDTSALSKNSRIDQLLRQLGITDPSHPDRSIIAEKLEELHTKGTTWLLQSINQAISAKHPEAVK